MPQAGKHLRQAGETGGQHQGKRDKWPVQRRPQPFPQLGQPFGGDLAREG